MPRSKRIAVVINLDWTMKHHQEVFAGTQEIADENGWKSTLWPFAPDVADKRGRKLYDGIVGRVHPELETRARKARIPVVNTWISSPCADVPAVFPDVRAAGAMAAEHLRARGFRRFAYVGYTRTRSSQWMQTGMRDVARENKLKMAALLVSSTFSDSVRSWTTFHNSLRKWAKTVEPPVGVACINDKVARYVINAVTELGHAIPEDVAVVGLENEEVVCLNPDPSISSIDLGWHQVGTRACELLGKLMTRAKPSLDPVLLPPVSLIPRQSTDSFKVDDEYVAQALRFIAERSHQPIKVSDVVESIPISWRSLERRFRECRSSTINSEITRFRIERAKRLLAESDMLVKQIAEACGFRNTRRLCEVFKRLEDLSPEQFRLQRKNPG